MKVQQHLDEAMAQCVRLAKTERVVFFQHDDDDDVVLMEMELRCHDCLLEFFAAAAAAAVPVVFPALVVVVVVRVDDTVFQLCTLFRLCLLCLLCQLLLQSDLMINMSATPPFAALVVVGVVVFLLLHGAQMPLTTSRVWNLRPTGRTLHHYL